MVFVTENVLERNPGKSNSALLCFKREGRGCVCGGGGGSVDTVLSQHVQSPMFGPSMEVGSSAWGIEAGGSGMQLHSQLYSEFEAPGLHETLSQINE